MINHRYTHACFVSNRKTNILLTSTELLAILDGFLFPASLHSCLCFSDLKFCDEGLDRWLSSYEHLLFLQRMKFSSQHPHQGAHKRL